MDGFNGIGDIIMEDDKRQINRWKKTVGISKKLIKKGKDSNKIRKILLH